MSKSKTYIRIVKKFPKQLLRKDNLPKVEEHLMKWLNYYEMLVRVTKQSVKHKKAQDNLKWWREQKEWYDEYHKDSKEE